MKRFPRLFLLATASLFFAAQSGAQPHQPAKPQPPKPPRTGKVTNAAPGTLQHALDLAASADYPAAERELNAIQGADRSGAMLGLARVMFEQGKFADADKFAQQVNGKEKLEALALRAEVMHAQGKTQDAIKLLEPQKDAKGAGGRRVRLALGECYIAVGRRSDAEPVLKKFADEYNNDELEGDAEGLGMLGRAMYLIRYWKNANDGYNFAERIDKDRVETLLWRAELFLEKYNPGSAEEVTRDALKLAPKRADALVMMARVKLDQAYDFDSAEKLVKEALDVNPNHVGARAVLAGLALRDLDIQKSEAEIQKGLAINPNDLELLSLKAAARFLADDRPGYEQAKKDTLARNATYSQFFGIVGEYAEWEHRYDDIVAMMKEAVALDNEDSKAWAQLGLTQMRGGDEAGGMKSLDEAWKNDHFNVRVKNTLDLYEKQIPNQYDLQQEGVFKIRYPKSEQKVLQRYVPGFMGQAWGSMKLRYDFAPTNPIQVELYEQRQQFSVRTSGLPNIGIQGVCFGRVVASMSPHSEPFNWGNVLWHELGHVFAIQLSKNHVPRWFTEGLSEYETIIRRPEWQRENDPEFYLALTRNALPGAVEMNRAFTHASDELDVTTAYYAASQMIVFTAETFGFSHIVEALKLWGDGVRTAQVIEKAFGVSAKDYDEKFRAWAHKRLARYDGQFMFDPHPKPIDEAKAALQANPNSADAHVGMALALLRMRKIDEAKVEIDAAIKLDAKNKMAHFLAAKFAGGKKDTEEQLKHLKAIQDAGGDGYTIQIALANVAEAKKDKAGMKAALETAYKYDPSQSEPLKGLYDLAKEDKKDDDMLEALRKIARLEQHDRRVWRMLLEALVDKKLWDEAARVGEGAIFVDVESAPTHIGYGRALAALGRHEKAAFEFESAIFCNPDPQQAATAHALWAKELVALGKNADAKTHLDEAVRLDAGNEDAKAVKIP